MKEMPVSVDVLEEYEFTHRMAGHHGKGFNRTLDAIVKNGNVRYQVESFREVIKTTRSLGCAVQYYNEIQRVIG